MSANARNVSDTPKNLQARRQGFTEELLQYIWEKRPELSGKGTPTIQAALSALKREIERADGPGSLDGSTSTQPASNVVSSGSAIDYF